MSQSPYQKSKGPSAITSSDGGYQFPELPAGANYTVTPARQGFVFNPATRAFDNLQSDQRADFEAISCVFSISPRIQTFTATGGMGSVTITSPDSRCPWTAISREPCDQDYLRRCRQWQWCRDVHRGANGRLSDRIDHSSW